MRVVAGTAKGRRLEAPKNGDIRPTTDRVREAVFNALQSADAVVGARVLDLFAGTGAMGIEALSRGAEHATFVDRHRSAAAVIEANLERTGMDGRATVVCDDVWSFVADRRGVVDLAIIDPPYAFDRWREVLAAIDSEVVVVESDRAIDLGPRWGVFKEARYAATVVALARRVRGSGPRGDDA